jgi:hypothetical protein
MKKYVLPAFIGEAVGALQWAHLHTTTVQHVQTLVTQSRRPTVGVCALRHLGDPTRTEVLLIERGKEPARGRLCFPGVDVTDYRDLADKTRWLLLGMDRLGLG